MFRKGLVYQIRNIKKDFEGRMIIIQVLIEDIVYLLCNVYSHNEDKPSFFVNVAEAIESYDNRNIIWCGDFILAMNVELDRYKSTVNNDKSRDIVKAYIQDADLNDVWRVKNPDKKLYSFVRRRPMAMSRIDYFFVSDSLMTKVEECDIVLTPVSDHSLLTLRLRRSNNVKGPGVWQFNTSLLSNLEFLKELNDTVDKSLNKNKNQPPDKKWENIKREIRTVCQNTSKKIAAAARNRLLSMYDKLKSFRDLCCSNPQEVTQDKWNEYEAINLEFDKFLDNRAKGARLRCKQKWYEQGERSSKYFFSLEKANAARKCIQALKVSENKIIHSQESIMKEQVRFYSELYEADATVNFNLNLPDNVEKISQDQRKWLDRRLTVEELSAAVLAMPNDKTPGYDGLPIEIYKVLWSRIKIVFYEGVVELLSQGKLSLSMRKGI